MTAVVRHPARYSDQVLVAMGQLVDQLVDDQGRTVQVLDPFAGTGRVHELGQHTSCELRTFGVELEPEWAGMHERTIVGDARKRPSRWTARFDVVATSPCYGNRMADHHEAKDPCRCRRDRRDGPAVVPRGGDRHDGEGTPVSVTRRVCHHRGHVIETCRQPDGTWITTVDGREIPQRGARGSWDAILDARAWIRRRKVRA